MKWLIVIRLNLLANNLIFIPPSWPHTQNLTHNINHFRFSTIDRCDVYSRNIVQCTVHCKHPYIIHWLTKSELTHSAWRHLTHKSSWTPSVRPVIIFILWAFIYVSIPGSQPRTNSTKYTRWSKQRGIWMGKNGKNQQKFPNIQPTNHEQEPKEQRKSTKHYADPITQK